MHYKIILAGVLVFLSIIANCQTADDIRNINKYISPGAEQTGRYYHLLKGKNIAVVANQSSVIGHVNLVDSLIHAGFHIVKIFSPEHGFRGTEDAGAFIENSKDSTTGLPVISLYGKNKKLKTGDLHSIDIVVFDLQDVGVRFFTYISTLHYVMEACANEKKTLILLDRPNPNGFYIDGPVMEDKFRSFVGMHPVPIVYGMTIGEYAGMINGENWLEGNRKCKLVVIPVSNYTHKDRYELPVRPSPNLPNMSAVYLYPSLCFFEGTAISVGRGTLKPFQVFGHPDLPVTSFSFTPESIPGACLNPPYSGRVCHGWDVSDFGLNVISCGDKLYIYWLTGTYKLFKDKEAFFNPYFEKLAGTSTLKQQIIDSISEDEIYKSWEEGIIKFKAIREKYLLYPDFE